MRILLLALTTTFAATPLLAQRAADEAAVRARVAEMESAVARRDAAAYAALFAADADFISGDGPRIEGRAAIQATVAQGWAAAPDRQMTLVPTSVRFVGPDVAIMNTLARNVVGTTTTGGRGTWVLQREGGTWMIVALRVQQGERS